MRLQPSEKQDLGEIKNYRSASKEVLESFPQSNTHHIRQRTNQEQEQHMNTRYVKVDSEKSQFTQESCSAPDDNESLYSERLKQSNMINSLKALEDNPYEDSLEKQQNKRRIMHFKSADEYPEGCPQIENNQETYIEIRDEQQEEEKESQTTKNQPEDFIFGSFYHNKTSKFAQNLLDSDKTAPHLRKESNSTQYQHSSVNNLMSNDYNYSPDFRDSQSQLPPLESDGYSPALQYMQRNQSLEKSMPRVVVGANLAIDTGDETNSYLMQKQNLLKYEEFEGDCYTSSSHHNNDISPGAHNQVFFSGSSTNQHQFGQTQGDLRYSERMSDRIYERVDHTGEQSLDEDPFSFYNNNGGDSPLIQQQQPISPNNVFERKMPTLSIISEEDTQHQNDQSQYYANFSRLLSGGRESSNNNQNEFMSKISQAYEEYDQQKNPYNKSKSQPMKATTLNQRPRISPLNLGPQNMTTILIPTGEESGFISHKNTSSNVSGRNNSNQNNVPFPYHKTHSYFNEEGTSGDAFLTQRMSYDLKQPGEDEQLMRLQSHGVLRQSAQGQIIYPSLSGNNNMEYGLISEEDLLSNIDRQSRNLLPTSDFVSDEDRGTGEAFNKMLTPNSINRSGGRLILYPQEEITFIQKIREQNLIIETLKHENLDYANALQRKDHQLEDLLIKNEDLMQEVEKLNNLMSGTTNNNDRSIENMEFTMGLGRKRDFEIQVNMKKEFGVKKSGIKKRRLSSNIKQTPRRIQSEYASQEQQLDNSRSSIAKDYETPQLKKSINTVSESPMDNVHGSMLMIPKNQYQQMLDEINSLSLQIQKLRTLQLNLEDQNKCYEEQIEDFSKRQADTDTLITHLGQDLERKIKFNSDLEMVIRSFVLELDGLKANKKEDQVKITQLEKELGILKGMYGEQKPQIERSTSVTSLIPYICDMEVQTEPVVFNNSRHARNPSHYSNGTNKKESLFPHTIPLPEVNSVGDPYFEQQNNANNHYTTYSSKGGGVNHQQHMSFQQQQQPSPQNPSQFYHQQQQQQVPPTNITIINNKQELSQKLEQARDYELRAMRLQNEINEHRNRLLRENQDMLAVNMAQKEEFRRKLKKREAKIIKHKAVKQQFQKENAQQKVQINDLQEKLQCLRIKMETKVQEKDFKLMLLKNQMKHVQSIAPTTNGGAMTPTAHSSLNKVYSQNELLGMLSNLMQSKMTNKAETSQNSQMKERSSTQRPKSQETYSRRLTKEMLDSRRIHHEEPQSPEELSAGGLNNDQSSKLIFPPVFSVRDSSERSNISRRFENTMLLPRGGLMSPPLAAPSSFQYVPRSVPRSFQYGQDPTFIDFTSQFRTSYHPQNVQPSNPQCNTELPIYEEEKQQQDNRYIFKPSTDLLQFNQATFLKDEHSRKEEMRNMIQKRADRIQQSRNKREKGGSYQTERMKNTFSEGDFMKMKREHMEQPQLFERDTLQKICTTEISLLVDEKLEDSRQRRQADEELVTFSQRGSQQLAFQIPTRKMRDGNSSYHSATFRRLSVHQQQNIISPQKNLQNQFEHARDLSPAFYQSHLQSLSVNQIPYSSMTSPEVVSVYHLQQSEERTPLHVTHKRNPTPPLNLIPQHQTSTLGGGATSTKSDDRYLKNLMIREKQSRSRQQVKEPIFDSLNDENRKLIDNNNLSYKGPMRGVPVIHSVSVVSDDYNSLTHQTLVEKPPLPKQMAKMPSQVSLRKSSKDGISESPSGYFKNSIVNIKINPRIEEEQEGKQSASQNRLQKLEDIKRKYGRSGL